MRKFSNGVPIPETDINEDGTLKGMSKVYAAELEHINSSMQQDKRRHGKEKRRQRKFRAFK